MANTLLVSVTGLVAEGDSTFATGKYWVQDESGALVASGDVTATSPLSPDAGLGGAFVGLYVAVQTMRSEYDSTVVNLLASY